MSLVQLKDLSLRYPLYGLSSRSLKKELIKMALGKRLGIADEVVVVNALENLNLNIEAGQKIGLVGNNGAGKSTLLKVLAGIYPPTTGKLLLKGTVGALFDVHFGMDFEATGYENVYIRAYLLGIPRKKISAMMADIEEFTELGEFLEMPVKSYSNGMLLRLSFGLSTMVAPNILLIDEIINVGDAIFIEKAKERLAKFIHQSDALLLASHANDIIESMCTEVLWLDKGRIKQFGTTAEVMSAYKKACTL